MKQKNELEYLLNFYEIRKGQIDIKLRTYIGSIIESIEKIDEDHAYFFWKPYSYHDDVYELTAILRILYNKYLEELLSYYK